MSGVTGTDRAGRRWSIGELARATGMTVRALYHYDEIGLLTPSERTASGHRRYTERDLHRLHRVRALRALGLSLQEIADVLDGRAGASAVLRELLAARLRSLDEHAQRIRLLQRRIRELLARLDGSRVPDPDQLMTILETMAVFDHYFTQEQQEMLAGRRAELGAERIEAAKRELVELVEELLRHMAAGTPADDARVRDLARRWDELGAPFHPAGEPAGAETRAAARRMWRENAAELGRGLPWPAERINGLVAYLEQARQAG